MPDHWRIRVDDSAAKRQLRLIETALSDLRPFWPVVTRLFRGWMKKQFDTEGAFAKQRWRALSPAYAAQKQQLYPGRGILHASGAMRRAVDSPTRAATPMTLTLTIDDPKLEFHQEGTPRMPARPVIFTDPIPAAAHLELQAAAEGYVNELFRALR